MAFNVRQNSTFYLCLQLNTQVSNFSLLQLSIWHCLPWSFRTHGRFVPRWFETRLGRFVYTFDQFVPNPLVDDTTNINIYVIYPSNHKSIYNACLHEQWYMRDLICNIVELYWLNNKSDRKLASQRLLNWLPLSQWFGYPCVLGTPIPKSLVFWVSLFPRLSLLLLPFPMYFNSGYLNRTIRRQGNSQRGILNSFQRGNDYTGECSCSNKLVQRELFQGNFTKYGSMLISKQKDANINIDIDGNKVSHYQNIKLLGVNIDSQLTFNNHISEICKKLVREWE